jgi:hypothetical protein
MIVLALDISTKTGFAVLDQDLKLITKGLVKLPKKISEYGIYPWSYIIATEDIADSLIELIVDYKPDFIVIEETNGSRARYTQKVLEFLHASFLVKYKKAGLDSWTSDPDSTFWNLDKVKYVNSSEWRKVLGLLMSKQDKKNNQTLNKAKRNAENSGLALDKTALGIKGKVTKKHLSVRYVNEKFGLFLKIKDNDIADAICLGTAYIKGAKVCDGK